MEVRCGREFYSKQAEMVDWCKENIGPGGWDESPALLFPDRHKWIWTVRCMFGYTTFVFTDATDGKKFKDEWGVK